VSTRRAQDLDEAQASLRGTTGQITCVVVGGICGLAWATGLRGFMAQIAGPASQVHWGMTFGWILVPGVLIGMLLGWAEHLRRTGGRPGWRWLALAPLLFSSVLLSRPGDLGGLLDDGVGGGAIGVPIIGMIGGYAMSGRGPVWARAVSGLLAFSAIPIWAATATSVGGPAFALDTAYGAWIALYYWSFLAIFMMACAIPHRAASPRYNENPPPPGADHVQSPLLP
jgi:hypothetical protein